MSELTTLCGHKILPANRRGNFRRVLICSVCCASVLLALRTGQSASYYARPLSDPTAIQFVGSGGGDDTAALQQAINQVQEKKGQGIVFVPEGRYRITGTIHIWPGIRVLGVGRTRPVLVLPASTPGFQDAAKEKVMLFFAGGRPGFGRGRRAGPDNASVPDASPGTFYSAMANIDIEVKDGNAGAVVVRARYAQHCFLAHMDFHLGPALAGIHEAGNVAEDLHFFGGRYAIWTSKPSPGWQFTVIDSVFENQREAAIFEREAGLTLVRPIFRHEVTAVAIEPGFADELWVKDARLEEISGPAFAFDVEKNPRNEINFENVTCRAVPTFALLRSSGRQFSAPADAYRVATFSHGLHFADPGAEPKIESRFDATKLSILPSPVPSDLPPLPPCETWANLRELGAKGDGVTDDTQMLQQAIASHRTLYLPSGFYVVRDTIKLRPDTVLIGLHPGATQLILLDGTPAYQAPGAPKALLEAPQGGSNIVIGIGLYTSGNNPGAVAALWKAGAQSMMNDVRFLGGHGTPKPDGSRENPYNRDHSGDPIPGRAWDSQYPSLWVTDGGGGTFLDIWTPSTFARAGMLVSDTATEGRVYQMSSEHHVRHEVQLRNAAHWRFYALQTEAERGESGLCLPLEIESSHDITVANFHIYRVISSYQPFPWAAKVSGSRDIHFRNLHCYSNSKVSFDSALYCEDKIPIRGPSSLSPADGERARERGPTSASPSPAVQGVEVRQREFAWLDVTGRKSTAPPVRLPSVVAAGAKVEKLAGGFYNISGGAAAPNGDFYFVDAHPQRILRWSADTRQVSTLSETRLEPVSLACDRAGNLLVVSYSGQGVVYTLTPDGVATTLKPATIAARPEQQFYLPVSDWRINRDSLSHPAAHFLSLDGTTVLSAGADFLNGAVSWGVKSSPPIRSFGLAPAKPGQTFYLTDEAQLTTWAAKVHPDGNLTDFRLFAENGGEGVAVDERGNVYLAAGQIEVYNPQGKPIGTIRVPERPLQVVFGGAEHRTLFIPARTSLYAVRMRYAGR